jgi:hypothetical protein
MCLNKRGYRNVLAVGGESTALLTMHMLCEWADKILLAKPTHNEFVTSKNEGKIDSLFTIGDDIWFNPFNEELHKIINKQLDKIKL